MQKNWFFEWRMSFETYGNCCQMLLNLLKLSSSSFFNISNVGFNQGTSCLHIFWTELGCVSREAKLNCLALFYFWRDFCSNFCLLNQSLAAALSITFLVVERRIDLQNYCLLRSPCGRLEILRIACGGVLVAAWRSLECWSKLASWQTASGTASVGRQRWYSSERRRVS
jgi:hypothetical protein